MKLFRAIWEKLGGSEKARRRNAGIILAIIAAVVAFGFYTGALKFSFSMSKSVGTEQVSQ